MDFQNKTLTCYDCDKPYTFTVEEQEQFHTKGYTNEPKRCPECRQARKANRTTNSGNNNFGNSSYATTRPQMFPVVCSDCGKGTSVPFEPRQGRPVYCSDCYRKVRVSR
jgi:CxxC-x17-CxxC domain-containing protein